MTNQTDVAALARDVHALVNQLRRKLRERTTVGDFTSAQIAVLSRLDKDGPATVTALALAEGVRPQSLGATVASLEAAGAIEGEPDPNDGRRTILSLTDTFRIELAAGRARKADWLTHSMTTKFSAEERQQLATGVELLKRLVDN